MVSHPCPDDEQLLAFVEGLLGDAERARMEGHLAECPQCSALAGAIFPDVTEPELTRIGRYVVRREIGRGGMGRVLEAYDPALDRTVAIKLILPAALSSAARERFMREAETLGAMRHPNVIEVFDVGEFEGAPYFVMEFVEGDNLDVWSRDRDVGPVLACLRAAGRGLAAAHAKGVLHRDFKPSNVIVGEDGRARVGDFGLAGFDAVLTEHGGQGTGDSLTKTGAVMGTLPYMAPELLDGGKASTASDQFAFCVSMYEVLYGRRPFSGGDARSLSAAIRESQLPEVTTDRAIPRRARAAMERGLSPRADDRHPSMQALLRQLRPTKVVSTVGLGLIGAGAAATVAFVVASPRASECSVPKRQLAEVYGKRVRAELEQAFARSALPYAQASARSTLGSLDAYAETWVEGATATCHSAERGDLTDTALDLRMHCFQHALRSFSVTVEQLGTADTTHIRDGHELVGALPNAQRCSDSETLARTVVLPQTAEQSREEETLGPLLEESTARVTLDDFDGAWRILEDNADALEAASYPPIVIRTLALRARILLARQDLEGAKALSLQAHERAVALRLDHDASRTATFLGLVTAREGDITGAQRWYDAARTRAKAGGFDRLEAMAMASAAQFYSDRGELDRAVDSARGAVELIDGDETYPPTSRAELLLVYARALLIHGGSDDGLAQVREAQRLLLEVHGDTHPALVSVQQLLQMRASQRGDYEAALEHARESYRIDITLHGTESLRAVVATMNLAISLYEMGELDEAAGKLRHADALLETLPKTSIAVRIPVMVNLANVMLAAGKNDDAKAAIGVAQEIIATQPGHRKKRVVLDSVSAHVEARIGNLEAARRFAERALELSVEIYGDEHVRTAETRVRLAQVEVETGHPERARALLDRALDSTDLTEADRGEATFLLARAVFEGSKASEADRIRGLELAREAERALASKASAALRRGEVLDWLDTHGGAP